MTFASWARTVFDGWQVHRTDSRILRSHRPASPSLSVSTAPAPSSSDEVDASVVDFRLLASTGGLSAADVAAAVRDLRTAHARRMEGDTQRARQSIRPS